MIRAGRRAHVRTMEDLALGQGMTLGSFRNKRSYLAEGHPQPISSKKARTKLWDAEQVEAYGAGQDVPDLQALPDSDDDLLDRHEAAAELDIKAKTWDDYKNDPLLREHLVEVAGVEHWPRGIVRRFDAARPGKPAAPGRPRGSGDQVPRELLHARIAELLDEAPHISASAAADELGVHQETARTALADVRGACVADLLEREPGLDAQQAAERLGYPVAVRRSLAATADAELRVRALAPYIHTVVQALVADGLPPMREAEIRQRGSGVLTAAVVLPEDAPAPALVWDERYGWRTAPARLHPTGKDTAVPPQGEGIRYLTVGGMPAPDELVAVLGDGRRGSRRPPALQAPGSWRPKMGERYRPRGRG